MILSSGGRIESVFVLLAKDSLFFAFEVGFLATFFLVAFADGGAVEASSALMDSKDLSVSSSPYNIIGEGKYALV